MPYKVSCNFFFRIKTRSVTGICKIKEWGSGCSGEVEVSNSAGGLVPDEEQVALLSLHHSWLPTVFSANGKDVLIFRAPNCGCLSF